ncbi:plastocyanin/azurin family copper-binding protein [Haloarcula salinisoli]|uniref:Halocyanin n=1 Tax=Haloarcula salinisoli TaxID=2487746 RepID=A0A8J7YCP7_9EURY|nr:plastocyanin/azurin family copper-binding protein [Halomicroarcula salinisoli]MBX0303645.1 halocyanin [Halomicroarcula salinisoli]
MERRAFLRAAVPTAAVGLAGCIGGSTPTDYDVGMGAKEFRPETLEVTAGTTVTWLNTNKQGHSVTAYESELPDGADYFASGGFDSEKAAEDAWGNSSGGTLFEGQTFEHTFEVPGEYPYFCIPHERGGMVGSVVVTGDRSTTETSSATRPTDGNTTAPN